MPTNFRFSTVLHKRSSVAGATPALTSLSAGELAMNVSDGKLFIKTVGEQIKTFSNDGQSAFTLIPVLSGVEPQYGGNAISQVFANVLGGYNNDVSGAGSTTVNGEDNDIAGDFAFIGSGLKNKITASGDYSAILGGQNNLISHQNSFTIGSNLSSHAENFTYVNNISGVFWGDGSNLDLTNASAIDNQVRSLTGNWNTTYTTVQSNSANWNLITITDPLKYSFIGDGVTTSYSVSGTNNSINASYIDVYVANVKQEPIASYTLSADKVTFLEPPEFGTIITIITPNTQFVDINTNQYIIPQYTALSIPLSTQLWNETSSLISYGNGSQMTNIAVGNNALKLNTTGNFNVSLGSSSLYNNTDGSNNVSIGSTSMYNNTNGFANVAVGRDALYNNTTGQENMAQGYRALFNSNSNWNVAVGSFALFNLTTGERNVGIGKDAAISNVSGEGIVAVGDRSAASSTNRSNITAVGRQALFQITGSENTAVGAFSQANYLSPNAINGTASNNTSLGYSSLAYVVSGSNNVAVGHTTLLNNLTGNNNTAIGYGALNATDYTNTAGIGYQAAVTGDNQIQLGNSSTTTYTYSLQSRSDLRDKTDIRECTLGLDFISKLRPVDFKWDYRDDYKPSAPIQPTQDASETDKQRYKEDLVKWTEACNLSNIQHDGTKKRNRYHHGLIAQDLKEVLEAENIDFGGFQDHKIAGGDDVYTIGYIELIAPLIKSIQELNLKLIEAQNEIADLKTKIK